MKTNVLLLVTILLWGIAPIFDKAALRGGDPFIGATFRGMMTGLIMVVIIFSSGRIREIGHMDGRSLVFFLLSGIFAGALGTITYLKALQDGSASRIVPLAATYPLVTAVLGVFFLGESLSVARIAGIILIVAGIILVK